MNKHYFLDLRKLKLEEIVSCPGSCLTSGRAGILNRSFHPSPMCSCQQVRLPPKGQFLEHAPHDFAKFEDLQSGRYDGGIKVCNIKAF